MNCRCIPLMLLAVAALSASGFCEDLLVTKEHDEILGFKKGDKFKTCYGETILIPEGSTVKKTKEKCHVPTAKPPDLEPKSEPQPPAKPPQQ